MDITIYDITKTKKKKEEEKISDDGIDSTMLNENDRFQTINSTSPPMLALCIRGCLTELIVYLSI